MGPVGEATPTAAQPTEQSVHDVILEMLEDDAVLDMAVKNAVLDALAAVEGQTPDEDNEPTPTFLTTISVAGFRGIGPQARLDLYPAPGLMVVSGRNGSGKSSFAEALELALTGTSYRWHKKESLWAETWQNLHRCDPCAIRIGFTAEDTGPFTVGMDWAPGAALSEHKSWTQAGATAKRVEGTESLGWGRALELSRPVLSYEELGRLFDGGPSALYDALAKLLGLEALADAEKLLAAQLKSAKADRDHADDERKRLMLELAVRADDRAEQAATLLKKKGVALDHVLSLATGSNDAGRQTAAALRALTQLDIPSLADVESATRRLRGAARSAAATATNVAQTTQQRVDLLQNALRYHEHAGDGECPVCGQGRLDSDWANQARDTIASSEDAIAEYRSAATELTATRQSVAEVVSSVVAVESVDGVELPALDGYNDAVTAVQETPLDDSALADHVESTMVAVAAAAETLRSHAAEALGIRENTWAPVAAQLGAWVALEEKARSVDDTVKTMTAAKKWMTNHALPFRNLRLKPIAEQARKIWGQLRQESNVDLGEITLEGTATRRKAVLGGSVDGQPTKALSVMSQGELHALALALFLPRATALNSPFRFVVLDDPIQAMDPAKIDGFVQVLTEIAATHQVIVFSHDDRLASVIRETGVDARLAEVVRESGSKIAVRDNINPAIRQVNDIFALIKDERLSDDVKSRVLPGLVRVALESAARQAFYTKRAFAGSARSDAEAAWLSAKKTGSRLALAIHGNPAADLTDWLDAKPERRRSFRLSNAVHGAAAVSMNDARDVERTVLEVLALK